MDKFHYTFEIQIVMFYWRQLEAKKKTHEMLPLRKRPVQNRQVYTERDRKRERERA